MMYHVKKYVIATSIMLVTSVVSLLLVSILAYVFKWQADKAMVGIIVTYILAGFAGGFGMRWVKSMEYGKDNLMRVRDKTIEALFLSSIFMLLLAVFSVLRFQNTFVFSGRFLMIWGLVASSAFFGRWMGK